MKAVILAAGIASRLRPYTQNTPKALVKVGKKTILAHILDSMIEENITDIVITTGHKEGKLKRFIQKQPSYKKLNILFVFNPKYSETNYIYSLYLAKEYILNNDILLVHGDMLFDKVLLKKILKQKKSTAMVNRIVPIPEKDFKARLKRNRIIEIGVDVKGDYVYTFMPLYKLQKKDVNTWFSQIDIAIQKGAVKIYAEHAFNEIADKLYLQPTYYTHEVCMEIDTPEDLAKAEQLLQNRQ